MESKIVINDSIKISDKKETDAIKTKGIVAIKEGDRIIFKGNNEVLDNGKIIVRDGFAEKLSAAASNTRGAKEETLTKTVIKLKTQRDSESYQISVPCKKGMIASIDENDNNSHYIKITVPDLYNEIKSQVPENSNTVIYGLGIFYNDGTEKQLTQINFSDYGVNVTPTEPTAGNEAPAASVSYSLEYTLAFN